MLDKMEIKGYFNIQCLDKDGKVLDSYEENNLIMDTATSVVAKRVSGLGSRYINKIVLGTQGHNFDILIPKDINSGFVSSRTQLFSEESDGWTYPINFRVDEFSGVGTVDSEPDSGTLVTVSQLTDGVQYRIEIPTNAGNDGGTVVYTEAALYSDDTIFSMKCFKGKIKDEAVRFVIVWDLKF